MMYLKWIARAMCLIILAASCNPPAYLPKPEQVHTDPYGSYISLVTRYNMKVEGELIAVNDEFLTVRVTDHKKIRGTPYQDVYRKEIVSFYIQYAYVDYAWSMGASSLASLLHGWWLILTIPANLAVTSLVTVSGRNGYRIQQTEITYHDLYKYARFPQGMPAEFEKQVK